MRLSPPRCHSNRFSMSRAKRPLPAFKIPSAMRSRNMQAIRSGGNGSTEASFRMLLIGASVRGWKMRVSELPGSPDFFFGAQRLTVFIDGCFWHGCPRCGHIPKTNRVYWQAKIARNRRRDRSVSRALKKLGYRVIRIWECQLRTDPEKCLQRIRRSLRENQEVGDRRK